MDCSILYSLEKCIKWPEGVILNRPSLLQRGAAGDNDLFRRQKRLTIQAQFSIAVNEKKIPLLGAKK